VHGREVGATAQGRLCTITLVEPPVFIQVAEFLCRNSIPKSYAFQSLDAGQLGTYNPPHGRSIKFPISSNCCASRQNSITSVPSLWAFRLGSSSRSIHLSLPNALAVWQHYACQCTPLRCDDLQNMRRYAVRQPCRFVAISRKGISLNERANEIPNPAGRRAFSSNDGDKEEA
jgi:hypothetical protein